MPDRIPIFKILWDSASEILLAVFGAFVGLMASTETQISPRNFLATLATAGFVGALLSLLLYDSSWTDAFKGFIIGTSGACANKTLTILKTKVSNFVDKVFK